MGDDSIDLGVVPRVLGLDVGDRRIGVAISDGLGLTAQPLFTLQQDGAQGGSEERAEVDWAVAAEAWGD